VTVLAKKGLSALERVPLFAHLSRRQLRRVLDLSEEYRFEPGATLAKEGGAGDTFFVLLDGQARVVRQGRTAARLRIGDFFGEIALLDGGPRTASVVAETPVRCILILGQDFRKLAEEEPLIAVKVLRELAARLRRIERPATG
jgi:CRP/FNR family transcriptional regulator, cyclic AMP receptor protein